MRELLEGNRPESAQTDKPPVATAGTGIQATDGQRPARPPQSESGARAQAAVRLVDRTFHWVALGARLLFYLLLERLAAMVEIGPHLMSGLLLGDLAAAVWLAYRDRHFRLRAEAAQVALLVAISTVWWVGHDWPGQAEHEALLALVAIGTIAGRIGQEQRNYSFSD
jgi:hypothetical protein